MTGIKGSRAAASIQQAKRRIVKMLVVVTTVFALSWLPLYAIKLRLMFGEEANEKEGAVLRILFPLAQWLGSSNCCVNPFIYCCFSRMYRDGMRALLGGRQVPIITASAASAGAQSHDSNGVSIMLRVRRKSNGVSGITAV